MAFLDLATHFAGACFLAWFACWIGLRAWRCQAAAHWTERARLLWPARVTAGINLLLLPVMVDQTRRLLFPERTGWWIADGLAACLGALLGTYPLARSVFPELRFRSWLWQTAILCSLWGSVWIAMLAGVFLMPVKLGWGTVGVAGGYLAFNLALSWGLAVRVLRLVGLLRPPDETLERIVAESAARAAMPAPRAWLMGGVQALAFALPTTRQLVLSKRLLEICTEEEASAICAHEL
ncbi:MAG TPA: M48 family metalloprotease, partial [Dongiaceae bacterium]|nr:M48 family metalloprotease [Dongiaceae bacterium]